MASCQLAAHMPEKLDMSTESRQAVGDKTRPMAEEEEPFQPKHPPPPWDSPQPDPGQRAHFSFPARAAPDRPGACSWKRPQP